MTKRIAQRRRPKIYKKRNWCSLAGALLGLMFCVPVSDARADWVNDTPSNCFDPMLIRQQHFLTQWAPSPLPVTIHGSSDTHSNVEINQKYLNDGTIKFDQLFTTNSHILSKDDAKILSVFIQGQAHKVDIPFWSQQIPGLAGVLFTAGQGVVLGVLSSLLFDELGAQKIALDGMQAFVAEGGGVYQLGQLDQKNGNAAFTEVIQYRVAVGNETRQFILASCAYPAAIVVKNVKTLTPAINPKIFQDTGADWVMKNGSTGAVEKHFNRTSVDDNFYTLQETGISPDIAMVLRISRTGGPIQMEAGGAWQTLYSTSEVF